MTATPKDLQDEVGRLRDEIAHMRKALVGIYNRLPIVRTTEPIVVSGLLYDIGETAWRGICPPKETPPESADESEPMYSDHPGCNYYSGGMPCNKCGWVPPKTAETQPQACEHHWRTLSSGKEFCGRCKTERDTPQALVSCLSYQDDPTNRSILLADAPQACEHKSIDTYQGKPFCKRCGKTVEPNAPQEPKEGELDG